MKLHTYYCTEFTGHYPVGAAALVHAASQEEAASLLNAVLQNEHKLPGDAQPEDMKMYEPESRDVTILLDGNY